MGTLARPMGVSKEVMEEGGSGYVNVEMVLRGVGVVGVRRRRRW